MCVCVSVRERLRDRGFDLNSSLTQCGTTQECSNLEYVYKFKTAAVDLLTFLYLSDSSRVPPFL